jgi:uncharacterized membrane protein
MPYILVIGGIIGLICSFVLSHDKMELLQNPNFVPNCNLNPVISCNSVTQSAQGTAFGFPNAWIGLAGFAAFITVGAVILAGATFKRWFWIAFEVGVGLSLAFAYWLLWQSMYRINALCPYCLAVDVVMTTVFWYLTLYVTREGHVPVPRRLIGVADFARQHHVEILTVWFLVIMAVILHHFWYYYGQYV